MSRRTKTLPEDYFLGMYASDPDPWRFTSSSYERDKYAATLAALPQARYRAAFEPACSIGVFTHALSERCERLLATDLVPAALEDARARCADRPHVEIRQGTMPADWPEERFDLIVLSEFLYFLAPEDFAALVRRAGATIAPAATSCWCTGWARPTTRSRVTAPPRASSGCRHPSHRS